MVFPELDDSLDLGRDENDKAEKYVRIRNRVRREVFLDVRVSNCKKEYSIEVLFWIKQALESQKLMTDFGDLQGFTSRFFMVVFHPWS